LVARDVSTMIEHSVAARAAFTAGRRYEAVRLARTTSQQFSRRRRQRPCHCSSPPVPLGEMDQCQYAAGAPVETAHRFATAPMARLCRTHASRGQERMRSLADHRA
jgi:hypothetical protein